MDVASQLQRPSVRMSETHHQSIADKDCLVIDSFGLLSSIYRYGQVAYIGGGFGDGIHNTLEAAVYGLPTLFGPRYHKYKEAIDLIENGGGLTFTNTAGFISLMDKFLANPEVIKEAGDIVTGYVKQNSGVTEKILKELPL